MQCEQTNGQTSQQEMLFWELLMPPITREKYIFPHNGDLIIQYA